ncbi:MAG: 3-deoxy-8-phosphooctulonate synthase [Planctomycetota bacterium]
MNTSNASGAEGATCPVGTDSRLVNIGPGAPLAIIAGPCVLESLELGSEVAEAVSGRCRELGLGYIFKASFDKANRSSINSARGPGLERGTGWIRDIGQQFGCPTTTDLHEPAQAEPVAAAVDLLQIPAFLCRQTDLLVASGNAAATHGRAVNVKKGQFVSPSEMRGPVRKLAEAGCDRVILTDRGTFFGYHRLVNDFAGLGDMMELDRTGFSDLGSPPVCFDATHSCQTPGSGETTGGRRERAPLLARAAVAAGVHCVFMEVHPDPQNAMSDASTQLDIPTAMDVLGQLAAIRGALETRS